MSAGGSLLSSKGFTLMEVLIAVFIISTSFGVLMSGEGQGIDMAMRSKFMTTATLLAEKRISEVRSSKTAINTGATMGDFGADNPGYSYTEEVSTAPYVSSYYVYKLTILWGVNKKEAYNVSFVTFIPSTPFE